MVISTTYTELILTKYFFKLFMYIDMFKTQNLPMKSILLIFSFQLDEETQLGFETVSLALMTMILTTLL